MGRPRQFRYVRKELARRSLEQLPVMVGFLAALALVFWLRGLFASPLAAWGSLAAALAVAFNVWRAYRAEARSWTEHEPVRVWLEDGRLHMAGGDKAVSHPLQPVGRVRAFTRRGRLAVVRLERANGAYWDIVGLDDMDAFLAQLRQALPQAQFAPPRSQLWRWP